MIVEYLFQQYMLRHFREPTIFIVAKVKKFALKCEQNVCYLQQ
jgi:hypothetical protein